MERYGERIKELRNILGLSQQELASILGIHKQMISDVERGKQKRFSMESEALLIEKFHIDPIWLLTGRGEPLNNRQNRSGSDDELYEEMAVIKKYFKRISEHKRAFALMQIMNVLAENGR